ncbi:hypothetical protein P9B78_00905, partial [Bacillus paralicheniformis]|uniref:hypothetical protein n=1 Tax=Bacillus paralicheniformis TaxID=1648923 RepID=UPI002DBA91FD
RVWSVTKAFSRRENHPLARVVIIFSFKKTPHFSDRPARLNRLALYFTQFKFFMYNRNLL